MNRGFVFSFCTRCHELGSWPSLRMGRTCRAPQNMVQVGREPRSDQPCCFSPSEQRHPQFLRSSAGTQGHGSPSPSAPEAPLSSAMPPGSAGSCRPAQTPGGPMRRPLWVGRWDRSSSSHNPGLGSGCGQGWGWFVVIWGLRLGLCLSGSWPSTQG